MQRVPKKGSRPHAGWTQTGRGTRTEKQSLTLPEPVPLPRPAFQLRRSQVIYWRATRLRKMEQQEPKVSEVMSKSVVSVDLNTNVKDCAKAMSMRGVSCAVVM